MCNQACLEFGRRHLDAAEVTGRDVLEVGARIVQSPELTLRRHIESLRPARFLGIDLLPGPGVDRLLDVQELLRAFGSDAFDVVVCTEVVEHVRDWRDAFRNLKGVLRSNGALLLTTRAPGFPYHAWPRDYWRYTPEDLRVLLADLRIEALESDSSSPGVFVKARKPPGFAEVDLSGVRLVSVLGGARRLRPPSATRLALLRFAQRGRGYLRYLRGA